MNKTPNTNPTATEIATIRAAADLRNDGMTVAICDLATGDAGEMGNWARAEALAEIADMIATGRQAAA